VLHDPKSGSLHLMLYFKVALKCQKLHVQQAEPSKVEGYIRVGALFNPPMSELHSQG